jgi:hypothetical protein
METPLITEEDVANVASFPTLGPAWSASRRIAERVMADWQNDAIKPLIDEAVKEIGYRLWEDVQDSLQDDMEHNIAGHIRGMVDETVQALLVGKPWALERYALTGNYNGDEVRAAIAKHIPIELQEKRIADLEAENKVLSERIEFMQRFR